MIGEIDKNNQTDKSSEIIEEKICSICGITEKEAISKSITLIKMSDLLDKKCNTKFNDSLKSILSNTIKCYICDKCIEITNLAVEKVLNRIDEENDSIKKLNRLNADIESFEDYISSSAHLLKLDHINVIQSCLNVVISGIKTMSDHNPEISKKIIKSTIIELERELQELNNELIASER